MENLHVFTVSEINSIIKNILEETFPEIWVEGEISNFKNYSNHLFFTLKDEESQIKAVLFRSYTNSLKFTPKDGMKVLVRGRLTLYETRGEYQLVANYMEPLGIGILKIRFEELKKKLEEKGYFDEAKKKPIPLFPHKIGIITSTKGAVIKDMLNILKRRFFGLHIIIFPVKVQGEGAKEDIAYAINYANKHFKDFLDVIILARGGGSFEDLFAFNEEIVADAIYHSQIPIISAIGHETDFTIADFVADLRAPTPSAAAELVVNSKDVLEDKIYNLFLRCKGNIQKKLVEMKKKIDYEKRSLKSYLQSIKNNREKVLYHESRFSRAFFVKLDAFKQKVTNFNKIINQLSPSKKLMIKREKLIRFSDSLINQIKRIIQSKKMPVYNFSASLDSLSPLKVLSRGYSITKNLKTGKIVKSPKDVNIGDELNTTLQFGELISIVKDKRDKNF
ncbi:MAG: exodeoxyribonuclease VII large subunit [Proteobacteria bacterium]|nr:exodeoxyribonuclease VII large subunit [Pseudomonadota bacterium]